MIFGRILADLQPFLPLLPDISAIDLKNQEHLFHILYSAGVTASLSLHKVSAVFFHCISQFHFDKLNIIIQFF